MEVSHYIIPISVKNTRGALLIIVKIGLPVASFGGGYVVTSIPCCEILSFFQLCQKLTNLKAGSVFFSTLPETGIVESGFFFGLS